MKKFTLGIFTTIIVLALAGGAYYFGTKRAPSPGADLSASPSPASTSTPSPVADLIPTPDPFATVTTAIITKNYQNLHSMLSDPTQVRIESSGCCGPLTPQEVIDQLSYLDTAIDWDFSQTNPITAQLAAASPDYYSAEHIVGTASNNYAVSLKINDQGQITDISMVVDYNLLLP